MRYEQQPLHTDRVQATAPCTSSRLDAQDHVGNACVQDRAGLGPDVATDQQLLAEQMSFDAGSYALEDFTPSTGIGCFDAQYDPVDQVMGVQLRLAFDFEPAGASGWLDRLFDWPWEDDGWTEDAKAAWVERFVQDTRQIWGERFTFSCARPGWERYQARVSVDIQVVEDPGQAHYTVFVPRHAQSEAAGPRGEGHDERGWVGDGFAVLQEEHASRTPQSSAVAEAEAARLLDTLPDSVGYTWEDGRLRPAPGAEASLDRAVTILNAALPSAWKPIIALRGWRPAEETSERWPQAACEHAAGHLRAGGVPHPISVDDPLAEDGGEGRVTLTPAVDDGQLQLYRSKQHPFSRAGHEVGHMFGLIDEYAVGREGSAEDIAAQHRQFGEKAARMGTTAPSAPAQTSSLMSAGLDVLPCHAVSFHEALSQMTAGWLAPTDWKIGAVSAEALLAPPAPAVAADLDTGAP